NLSTTHLFFPTAPSPHTISSLSLHDALPISRFPGGPAQSHHARRDRGGRRLPRLAPRPADHGHDPLPRRRPAHRRRRRHGGRGRSEEHTSELQSLRHLVCRLLLEKKKSTAVT